MRRSRRRTQLWHAHMYVCGCVCARETVFVCVCVFELQNDLCAAYDGNISFMTLVNLLLIALNTCHSNNNEQKAATHIL